MGSEMCIRDSSKGAVAYLALADELLPRLGLQETTSPAPAQVDPASQPVDTASPALVELSPQADRAEIEESTGHNAEPAIQVQRSAEDER